MYPYIAPENFDNSRISSITNDQLIIKISDLLKQKEISKYITSKEKLLSLIKSHCEFFKISDDNENLEYNIPDNMTVFNILNIPLNMTKKDVIDNIELINLQFNRLYKRGFYWVLSTTEKETVICMQNSLRDLYFEESKVKYDLVNKNQILKNMKEIVEKNLYQKDTKNLGIGGNNYKKKNTFTLFYTLGNEVVNNKNADFASFYAKNEKSALATIKTFYKQLDKSEANP